MKRAGISEEIIRTQDVDVDDIAEAVSELSSKDDVVVLGEPDDIERDSFFKTIHQGIQDELDCPILVVLKDEKSV